MRTWIDLFYSDFAQDEALLSLIDSLEKNVISLSAEGSQNWRMLCLARVVLPLVT